MKKIFFSSDYILFSFIFKNYLYDPKNIFLFFGKKKLLNLFFLNPEFVKISLKTCFFYYFSLIKLKIPFIFIGKIDNRILDSFFEFFCIKNKLLFFNLNNESSFRKYRLYLKTKNLVIISFFLDTKYLLELKKDSEKFNLPLLTFSDLSATKLGVLNSVLSNVKYDYIQFLIILTLVNIYEKI